jgi:hypothetical protein
MKNPLHLNWLKSAASCNNGNNGDSCWIRFSHRNKQSYPTIKRFKKKAYDEWLIGYRQHSHDIGEIIYYEWHKPSRLASCKYYGGRFEFIPASDPIGENVGLARTHLVNGYPEVWKTYMKARAESSDICSKIKKIIDSFEQKIIATVEAETSGHNLVRRDINYSGKRCEDLHYYVDRHIFEAVFDLVQDRIENKPPRQLNKVLVNFNFDGVTCPAFSLSLLNGLGCGNEMEMDELRNRIENLINNPAIRSLVEQYNQKIENLYNNEYKKSYRDEIQNIWTDINDNGELLKADGECKDVKECKRRPSTPGG